MAHILHILAKPNDQELVHTVLERQKLQHAVEVVDLTAPAPDYDRLIDKIFDADSVEVW